MGAALVVLVLAGTGAFFGMRSKTSETSATGITGKFTVGAKVDVASKTIGKSGGQVVVGSDGGPVAGMTVDVPEGAFDKDQNVTISYRPITASTFPKDVATVSPLIDIEYGGGRANEPFKVTVPVRVAPGHFVMSFYYDDAAGRLEGIPIVAETADSVTIATDHFSAQVLTDAVEQALLSLTADSGFKPGVDDWKFPNYGSYLSPGGNCFGMTASAIYYYVSHRMLDKNAPQLNGLFDNNGTPNPQTPKIWQDDSHAYRLASVVQTLQVSWLFRQVKAFGWGVRNTDDRLTYLAIAEAIRATGTPQLLSIGYWDPAANGGKGEWYGHAIIAYSVDAGTISVADPNYAGVPGKIHLNGSRFDAYLSGENSGDPPTAYPNIAYNGIGAFVDFPAISGYWKETVAGTIGEEVFPELPVYVVTGTGANEKWVELGSSLQVSAAKLDLRMNPADTAEFGLWVDDKRSAGGAGAIADPYYGDVYSATIITLQPGQNRLGLLKLATPPASDGARFVDFQWVTVNYGGAVKISPNPATGQPDQAIKFAAEPLTLPGTPRWEWDFGDGTKVSDGGISQSHVYKKEGSYTLKVTVYDSYDAKTAKVVASGSVPVTVKTGTVWGTYQVTAIRVTHEDAGMPVDTYSYMAASDVLDTWTSNLAFGLLSGDTHRAVMLVGGREALHLGDDNPQNAREHSLVLSGNVLTGSYCWWWDQAQGCTNLISVTATFGGATVTGTIRLQLVLPTRTTVSKTWTFEAKLQ